MTAGLPMDRRSFVGATAAAVMAGVAGCNAAQGDVEGARSDGTGPWPSPEDGQRAVMLLGTSHLAQTPGDTRNTLALDAGDVLGKQRQRELATVTERLADWEPDRIAVEYPASDQSLLDTAYAAYTDEGRDVDAVSWETDRRDEIVQVGFRLAERLGHDSVAAVDYVQGLTSMMTDEEKREMPDSVLTDPESVEYPLAGAREAVTQEQQRLDAGSLVDHYKRLNAPDPGSFAWMNDQQLYATALEHSEPGDYATTKLLSAWWQRNIRIASNIWNVPDAGDERVLVVYGASHIPGLGQILTGTPMMAPVTPLPYLDA